MRDKKLTLDKKRTRDKKSTRDKQRLDNHSSGESLVKQIVNDILKEECKSSLISGLRELCIKNKGDYF